MANVLTIKTRFDAGPLKRAVERQKIRYLFKAGSFARTTASRSVRKRKRPAPPGQPPHSPTGQLRKSIRFAVDRNDESVVIGPTRDEIGIIGSVHEFGGPFRGRRYPARPFMAPAYVKTLPELPRLWADSIR